MDIEIKQCLDATDEIRQLIAELDTELNAVYAPENRHGLSIERLFQPGVMFFVARMHGQPVGCGGIAFISHGLAEVKRMYVRPAARRRHVAAAILSRLQQDAAARGVTRMVLETGDAQHAALRFYPHAGFTRCDAFGPYATMPPNAIAHSIFFEKRLA